MLFRVLAQELGYDEFDAMDGLKDMNFKVEATDLSEAKKQAKKEADTMSSCKREHQGSSNTFETRVLTLTGPDNIVHRINKRWEIDAGDILSEVDD